MMSAERGTFDGAMAEDFVELRVKVPRSWRTELDVAARAHAITRADLTRLVLREFLRKRYSPDEQQVLAS
jgi:hypothetical protein